MYGTRHDMRSFRKLILERSPCEQEKALDEFELDESYFGVRRARGKRKQIAAGKHRFLGF